MSSVHLWKASLTMFVGLLMVGWLMTSAADAGGKGKNKNKGKKKNVATEVVIVNELQATKSLIAMTNHDYQGHRSAAMHQVIHAIHLLQHKKHHPNPASQTANLKNGQKGTKEQQQFSDAQLAQSINNLQMISNQIQQLPGNHNHHHQALKAVHRAIGDLRTALKVA